MCLCCKTSVNQSRANMFASRLACKYHHDQPINEANGGFEVRVAGNEHIPDLLLRDGMTQSRRRQRVVRCINQVGLARPETLGLRGPLLATLFICSLFARKASFLPDCMRWLIMTLCSMGPGSCWIPSCQQRVSRPTHACHSRG